MQLGSLFPPSRSLADTVKKAAPLAPSSPVLPAANLNIHKPGQFNIKWPKAHSQRVKDYQAITTAAELKAYIERCAATGLGGFDYETGPRPEVRVQYENRIQQLEAEIAAAYSRGENAEAKALEASLKLARKDLDDAPLDPNKAEICALSLSAAPDEARALFISNKPGKRTFEPTMNRDDARRLVFDILEEHFFHSMTITKIAVNLAFEAGQTAAQGRYIIGPVADPFIMWIRCLQIVAPHKIKDPKKPFIGKGLKPMTKEVYGVEMKDFKRLLAEFNVPFFSDIPADAKEALNYSCEDSDYAVQHYLYWREVAKQIPMYDEWLHKYEMPFARVIGLMEYKGMFWDTNLADVKRQEAELKQEQAALDIKRIVKAATGLDINPGKTGKTNEVKSVLFDTMKIKAAKWSDKTGDASLDEEAIIDMRFMLEHNLEDIAEEKYLAVPLPDGWEYMNVDDNDINLYGQAVLREYEDPASDAEALVKQLREIPIKVRNLVRDQRQAIRIAQRQAHPYKDAALALLEQINNIQKYTTLLSSHIIGRSKYLNDQTGRIHARYSQWTETARLNSFQPNGQNVPRMDNDVFGIRNFYIPAPGKIMFFIDFSGFELRLMAWKSGDEVMLDIFNHDGDIHRTTGAEIAGVPLAEVTKKMRQDAKPANFGIAYGGTEHALQKTIKTDYGQRKSLDECLSMVNAVKRAYKRIPEYQRDIALDARDKGYVQTIYGYMRLLPYINSPNKTLRGSDERRAANTPIQGSAADVMKKCQNEVYDEIGRGTLARRLNPEAPVILCHGMTDMMGQIHDEILFEMDDDKNVVERAGNWVKALMEQPPLPGFPVKIKADASVGYRWGEKKELDVWLKENLG